MADVSVLTWAFWPMFGVIFWDNKDIKKTSTGGLARTPIEVSAPTCIGRLTVANTTSPEPDDGTRGQDLQIFDNGEFNLEITLRGDSFTIQAPGLARSLSFHSAKDMLRTVPEDEKGREIAPTPGGEQEIWHVTEPGFYRLIGQRQVARIKNEAVKDQVARFQRWVFHDVLPSIRKTGQYGIATISRKELARQWYEAEERAELESARADREAMQRMVEAAGRQAAEEEIAIIGPKAAAADHHRAADGLMTLSDFANKLKAWAVQNLGVNVKHKDVFDFLGEIGFICRGNSVRNNRPKAFATERDFIREKETEYPDTTGNLRISYSTRLTPSGDGWAWDRAVTRLNDFGSLRKPMGGAA